MTTPQAPAPRTEQPLSASINAGANLAPVLRKHVTTALCAAALAGGAWALGIRPLEASLARQSQEASRMRGEIAVASMDTHGVEELEQARLSAVQRTENTLAWASQTDDATEIYDTYSRIARSSDVNLQRIDPTGSRTSGARNTSRTAVAKQPGAPTTEALGYRVAIQGTYPQIVEFLGACETQFGASRIISFRLSANAMLEEGARTDLLDASIEIAHIKVTMPASSRQPRVEDRKP